MRYGWWGIRRGYQTGVFQGTFADIQHLVHGYSVHDFRYFSSYDDARMYVYDEDQDFTGHELYQSRSPYQALFQLHFDGASRGNPGYGGCGAVISFADTGDEVMRIREDLGYNVTNNVAEYNGLLIGLRAAEQLNIRHLTVYGDSEVVCRQMQGVYRCLSDNLRPLYEEAMELVDCFETFDIQHIARNQNSVADQLANEAIELGDDTEFYGFGH